MEISSLGKEQEKRTKDIPNEVCVSREPTDLLSLLATNVAGPHLVTKTFLPLLQRGKQKKILNM